MGILIFTKTGKLDERFYVDAGFILVLGGLSIALKDSKWFKLQPTIVGVIISIYVLH